MHSALPIIDFSPILFGSLESRQCTISEIDNALRTVGAFYLRNYGIERAKIDMWFEWSQRFFDLPLSEKERLFPTPRSFEQGYFGIHKEKVREQTALKENFDFGDPEANNASCWPQEEQLPGFRDFAADFHQVCEHSNDDKLLECLSVALNQEPDFFGCYHTGSMFVSSLIHYPAVSSDSLRSGQVVRSPAHSDLGTLTLLFQQNIGGLEVADMSSTNKLSSAAVEKSATFIPVEPDAETILVNVGYLLMRWSNARWKNSVHRVSEPPSLIDKQIVPERYSFAFFSFPDAHTVVEPLPACHNTEIPKRWGPINAGKYLLSKRDKLYS
ncbi:oxidoreductase [Pseudovirgaria hyperparasitica]|uniref:Oxidoreductase n=1 Tax=Pseudovirgaria hyperparasitica TaxID=470096 RepID=A0A6A6VQV0_9PEZI|nr:oxidoreductase [Pseudovirgaria hyperparasitica]KAF2752573.1 oxidoreductase [Pseudovirgaria hyperparasitica]